MPSRPPLLAAIAVATLAVAAPIAPGGAQERPAAETAADGTVRGRVLDAQSGEPVRAHVGVLAAGGVEHGATTDDGGHFTVRDVAAGAARVRVRALGYA